AEKVRSFGGRIEESGPTDLVAVFGLDPVDNAPSHAALAALAIQRATAEAGADASQGPAAVVAIHCAEHLVSLQESTAQIGVDGKAAPWSILEMLAAGDPVGAIVVSRAAVPFLARRFALEPVREARPEAWIVRRRENAPPAWSSPRF